MSKANKMFEELGYEKQLQPTISGWILYKKANELIGFFPADNAYVKMSDGLTAVSTVKEHQAIHEKLKELGWLE